MITKERILDVLTMEVTFKALIKEADERFPDWRGEGREEWVVNFSMRYLELYDNALPVIGEYLDTPVADVIEKASVKQIVKCIFDEMEKQVPVKKSPKKAKVKVDEEG